MIELTTVENDADGKKGDQYDSARHDVRACVIFNRR